MVNPFPIFYWLLITTLFLIFHPSFKVFTSWHQIQNTRTSIFPSTIYVSCHGIEALIFVNLMHIFQVWVKFCTHYLYITFIPNFVHHQFWSKFLQKIRYLLWFIFINLINCGASQSTNSLMIFLFYFCNGPFD